MLEILQFHQEGDDLLEIALIDGSFRFGKVLEIPSQYTVRFQLYGRDAKQNGVMSILIEHIGFVHAGSTETTNIERKLRIQLENAVEKLNKIYNLPSVEE